MYNYSVYDFNNAGEAGSGGERVISLDPKLPINQCPELPLNQLGGNASVGLIPIEGKRYPEVQRTEKEEEHLESIVRYALPGDVAYLQGAYARAKQHYVVSDPHPDFKHQDLKLVGNPKEKLMRNLLPKFQRSMLTPPVRQPYTEVSTSTLIEIIPDRFLKRYIDIATKENKALVLDLDKFGWDEALKCVSDAFKYAREAGNWQLEQFVVGNLKLLSEKEILLAPSKFGSVGAYFYGYPKNCHSFGEAVHALDKELKKADEFIAEQIA